MLIEWASIFARLLSNDEYISLLAQQVTYTRLVTCIQLLINLIGWCMLPVTWLVGACYKLPDWLVLREEGRRVSTCPLSPPEHAVEGNSSHVSVISSIQHSFTTLSWHVELIVLRLEYSEELLCVDVAPPLVGLKLKFRQSGRLALKSRRNTA